MILVFSAEEAKEVITMINTGNFSETACVIVITESFPFSGNIFWCNSSFPKGRGVSSRNRAHEEF